MRSDRGRPRRRDRGSGRRRCAAALDAGADRLELCQALETGGLTPSLGILESVLAAVDPLLVNVLVRPRAGGFVYSSEEAAVVEADIRACVERGAGGVVVGALTRDGLLDRDAMRRGGMPRAPRPSCSIVRSTRAPILERCSIL